MPENSQVSRIPWVMLSKVANKIDVDYARD
jgi:hypothetical protein